MMPCSPMMPCLVVERYTKKTFHDRAHFNPSNPKTRLKEKINLNISFSHFFVAPQKILYFEVPERSAKLKT